MAYSWVYWYVAAFEHPLSIYKIKLLVWLHMQSKGKKYILSRGQRLTVSWWRFQSASFNPSIKVQVAKVINGEHKKNVMEIMQCPEYTLKCNKSVHLPAWLSFLCVLGDLVVLWAWSEAGRALDDFILCAPSPNHAQITKNHTKHIRKTVRWVSEHFYWISVHIRDFA